jgi:hypothetical protein
MADLFTVSYGEFLWDSYNSPEERILVMATLATQSKQSLGLLATDGPEAFEKKRLQLRLPPLDIRLFKAAKKSGRWVMVDYDDRLPGDGISAKEWVKEYESVLDSQVVAEALRTKAPAIEQGFVGRLRERLVDEQAEISRKVNKKS